MTFRYPWPASALTPADLNLLYRVRESAPEHIPITQLIQHAVRTTYGEISDIPSTPTKKETHDEGLHPRADTLH